MVKKKKFKPIITRVKLNPEQAVLSCDCYTGGYYYYSPASAQASRLACVYSAKNTPEQQTQWGFGSVASS